MKVWMMEIHLEVLILEILIKIFNPEINLALIDKQIANPLLVMQPEQEISLIKNWIILLILIKNYDFYFNYYI